MPIQKITTGVVDASVFSSPTISGNLSLDSTGTTGVRVPSANTLAFHTSGTEDMRLTSDGILGIGITNPYTGTKLSVQNGATNTYSATSFLSGRTLDVLTNSSDTNDYAGIRFSDPSNSREAFYGVVLESGGVAQSFVWQGYNGSAYTERMRLTTAGLLQFNSGFGSVATAYGCRAWVNFNGLGTVAIRASGNVSSITDVSTGTYEVNFTTAMPDTNYAVSISLKPYADSKERPELDNLATNNVRVVNDDGMNNYQDAQFFTVAVFR
jgi:hypothetical protein